VGSVNFKIDGSLYPASEVEVSELARQVRRLDPDQSSAASAAAVYVETAMAQPPGFELPEATEEDKRQLRLALEAWMADVGYDALPERMKGLRYALDAEPTDPPV
jgi:hypothetical protein